MTILTRRKRRNGLASDHKLAIIKAKISSFSHESSPCMVVIIVLLSEGKQRAYGMEQNPRSSKSLDKNRKPRTMIAYSYGLLHFICLFIRQVRCLGNALGRLFGPKAYRIAHRSTKFYPTIHLVRFRIHSALCSFQNMLGL